MSFIVTLVSANETGGKSFISGVQNAGLAFISSGWVGFSVKLPGSERLRGPGSAD
jgi:hypothetical protein